MKRFFAILMTIFMLAGALSITAFAASHDPAAGTVIRVCGLEKTSETTWRTNILFDSDNFEEGWNYAMELAGDTRKMKTNKYDHVTVDIYADWKANDAGEFGSGNGFSFSTLYIPEDAKVVINLNGHTIDRDLKEWEYDGEVMYINEDANVTINNGTITGGWSCNGAGGINVESGTNLILNNVHIVGNIADDDDGGGIALYDATLVMNGGSFRDNSIDGVVGNELFDCYGGAIYIEDSTATFNGVEFKNNQNTNDEDYGAAIYADDSEVYLYECTFDGNGVEDKGKNICGTTSIVHAEDSELVMEKVTFTNNGSYYQDEAGFYGTGTGLFSSLIVLDDANFKLSGDSNFTNNAATFLISVMDDSHIYVEDTTFYANKSFVMNSHGYHYDDSYFKNCTFENNKVSDAENLYEGMSDWAYTFNVSDESLTFIDCKMSDSTYSFQDLMKFVDTDAANGSARRFGSIFGEGSLTMIVALLALIASAVSIFLTVYYNKKKVAPVAADNKEAEDEE